MKFGRLEPATGEELCEPCARFQDDAVSLLDYWYHEHFHDTFAALHAAVVVPLIARSRVDTRLLGATCRSEQTANGALVIKMSLYAEPSKSKRVEIDGESRPMFRVGTSNEWNGARWLTWDANQVGAPTSEGERPVYVQSHALRQLRRRVNLPTLEPYVEHWLYQSLREPNIVDRHGGDLIIEYRVQDYRLGYLVVTPLDDLVAVRTFKFLTMSNTSEGRMLERQLRLARPEVDWLGLHKLKAFTETDLSGDPLLRELLDKCGCGHLFSLRADDYAPKPKAAEVRRYLGLAA